MEHVMNVWRWSLLGVLLAAVPARAENAKSRDARELLRLAAAASSKLSAVAYRGQFHAEGPLADRLPKVSGSVVARRTGSSRNPAVFVEGSVLANGSTTPTGVKFASDGDQASYLDEAAKTFSTGTIADAVALPINGLLPHRFLGATAFVDEIRGASAQHEGTSIVDGVECDVISVQYDPAGTRSARIFVGRKDSLLRRIENTLHLQMPGRTDLVASKVVFAASALDAAPDASGQTFRLDCPEGYRRGPLLSPTGRTAAAGPLGPGSEAPDWELKDAAGKVVSLRSLRGKIVVMDFWATWCGPCRRAMPGMQKLHERFKDKPVVVYGMNCWERGDAMSFVRNSGFTYPQLLKADQVAAAYRVSGIPVIYTIGPDGRILDVIRGFAPAAEERLAGLIEHALKQTP
jgi:thiol-disulfide isomerase/thioredoxin